MPLCSQVLATDASEWGLGVIDCQWPDAAVAAAGRVREKWRVRDEDAAFARKHAQQIAASFATTGAAGAEVGLGGLSRARL